MTTKRQEVLPFSDPDAVEIGRLYALARSSMVGCVQYYAECGRRLLAKKAALKQELGHGSWLPWLEANENVLGFTVDAANKQMRFANSEPALNLNEDTALDASRKLWGHKPRGTQGTGENEWYTPTDVIRDARKVLGVIDLDPASSVQAQSTVQALQYFTLDDDGLKRMWHGNVWLNPPYAQPHIEDFADKMILEIKACRVSAAIMLTHNYTDTAWFQKLAAASMAICFPRGRIRFEAPDGTLAAPTQGQAFFYFGKDAPSFTEVFAPRGFVVGVLV